MTPVGDIPVAVGSPPDWPGDRADTARRRERQPGGRVDMRPAAARPAGTRSSSASGTAETPVARDPVAEALQAVASCRDFSKHAVVLVA
ncbi:Uncharacterised protein [Mycobacteroides abscessus subsp. abscessus]|nr:Uncharacterised protein [Mycobacteroides abscessus subsp. abscessus]